MKNSFPGKQKFALLLAAMLLTVQLTACGQTQQPASSAVEAPSSSEAASSAASQPEVPAEQPLASPSRSFENDSAYLAAYFDVDAQTQWTAESFSQALTQVGGEEATVEGELNTMTAVKAAVTAAAYDELAKSYPAEKAAERLEFHGVAAPTQADAAYLACALDTSLITAHEGAAAAAGEALTQETAAGLLMSVAEANGTARNFLGWSDDPAIHSLLTNTWNSFILFDDPALTAIGNTSVEQAITTGYNLKNDAYNARFLPELTIQYGHSDIKHAHQLMGLLNSEGIRARVQLEPKVSAFQYLLDWGPVPEPTPTYRVEQVSEELYVAFAVEYDLQLEFENEEDLRAFDNIIKTYAKKNEGNEEGIGMIYGAWWQPLYTVTREDMPAEDYYKIHDCVIHNGAYSIHPFCLDEKYEDTVAKLNAIDPNYQVEAVTRYCNKAFHNYMTGEDYQ